LSREERISDSMKWSQSCCFVARSFMMLMVS
jgi:hypothetical protein